MAKIKILAETYASESVVQEVLAAAREQDPKANAAEVIRDASGKVVQVEVNLPDIDAPGLATAADAINATPGVAKAQAFPIDIDVNFSDITAYAGLGEDQIISDVADFTLIGPSTDQALTALDLQAVDPVVLQAAGIGWYGAPSGGKIMHVLPADTSAGGIQEYSSGLTILPKNVSDLNMSKVAFTLSRLSGSITYAQGVTGTSRNMDVLDSFSLQILRTARFTPLTVSYSNASPNWMVNTTDTGISKDADLTFLVEFNQGTISPYVNGVLVAEEYRQHYQLQPDISMVIFGQHLASSGDSFYRPVAIDNVSLEILNAPL